MFFKQKVYFESKYHHKCSNINKNIHINAEIIDYNFFFDFTTTFWVKTLFSKIKKKLSYQANFLETLIIVLEI